MQPYLECLAFRLDADEGSICYSGDSGLCEPLIELARGCDVLVMPGNNDAPYYIVPDGPIGEQAYRVLQEAMAKSRRVGMVGGSPYLFDTLANC